MAKREVEQKGPQDQSFVTGHVLFSTIGVAIVTRTEGLGLLGFVRVLLFEKRFNGQEVVNSKFEL